MENNFVAILMSGNDEKWFPTEQEAWDYIFSRSCDDCKNKIDGTYQEICSNCKRFYGCYFEAKEKL